MPSGQDLTDADYRKLLDFRDGLRRFLRWSEEQARAVGLTPAQHQLLLAIRGHDDPLGPTIGDVASHLMLRHHSAVDELDPHDHRAVRLRLTRDGSARLAALTTQHLDELRRLEPRLRPIWSGLD